MVTLAGVSESIVARLPGMPDEVRRQQRALDVREHRPWPLPESPWLLAQSWHQLLFAHWSVAFEELRRVVPEALPIDTFEGRAWVGIAPFVVKAFRMRGTAPLPLLSSFPELNVRTYVTVAGKPGIYFLSLDADSRLAVAGARRMHRLPYFRADMSAQLTGGWVRYASRRVSSDGPPAAFRGSYRPEGNAFHADPGSLDYWLTERYCHYTLNEQQRVLRGEIHHGPWPLRHATAEIELNTMADPFGIGLEGEPLLHYSARQDTLLWGLMPA
jgi:uncharacterized protein